MGSPETTPVNVSKLVLEMGQLLDSVVTKKAQVSFDLAVDLPSVEADAAQLGQVVINLITNASEAIEANSRSDGRIVVRSGQVVADRQGISRMFLGDTLPVGPYVYFEVEDNGCGMDANTRARIFDPFFTTKFTGRGLGMAAVVGIVRKHRGAIDVETRVESGTRLRVLLPVGGTPPAVHDDSRSDSASWRSSGIVLVADDDEGVLDLMRETLIRAGLEVRTATCGDEALEIYRRTPDDIRAVLLDRTMPGTSGEDVLKEILAIRPDARILVVSGYSEQSSEEQFAGKGAAGFLQKPFLPETLLEKVRALIDN
jgi:CheY-like chemotaxis protein